MWRYTAYARAGRDGMGLLVVSSGLRLVVLVLLLFGVGILWRWQGDKEARYALRLVLLGALLVSVGRYALLLFVRAFSIHVSNDMEVLRWILNRFQDRVAVILGMSSARPITYQGSLG